MSFSLILLKKTATFALMILMGFFSVKSGRLQSEDSRVVSQLCFDWVIPLSLINAFLIEYTPETADVLLVLTMCIGSPSAALVTQMAAAHASLEEAAHAGSINVLTSLLCVITIPGMIFLYQFLC